MFVVMDLVEIYNIVLMIFGMMLFVVFILAIVIFRNYRKTYKSAKDDKPVSKTENEKGRLIKLANYNFEKMKRKKIQ
ncbi:hypothetical protein ACW6QP_14175 [Salegentibacter sp. HM20]